MGRDKAKQDEGADERKGGKADGSLRQPTQSVCRGQCLHSCAALCYKIGLTKVGVKGGKERRTTLTYLLTDGRTCAPVDDVPSSPEQ